MKKPLLTIDFNFGDHLPESVKPILPLVLAQIHAGLETMKPIHVAISAALVGDESFRVTVEGLEPSLDDVEGVEGTLEATRIDTGVECVRCGHGDLFHRATGQCSYAHPAPGLLLSEDPCECDRFEALA